MGSLFSLHVWDSAKGQLVQLSSADSVLLYSMCLSFSPKNQQASLGMLFRHKNTCGKTQRFLGPRLSWHTITSASFSWQKQDMWSIPESRGGSG